MQQLKKHRLILRSSISFPNITENFTSSSDMTVCADVCTEVCTHHSFCVCVYAHLVMSSVLVDYGYCMHTVLKHEN